MRCWFAVEALAVVTCTWLVVQRLVFQLILLIARHGVDAEDLKQLLRVFDTEHPPTVWVIICHFNVSLCFGHYKCHSFLSIVWCYATAVYAIALSLSVCLSVCLKHSFCLSVCLSQMRLQEMDKHSHANSAYENLWMLVFLMPKILAKFQWSPSGGDKG